MGMSRFNKIAVLMGGPSAEREVSLRSGAAVVAALRQTGRDVREIEVHAPPPEIPADVEAVFIALHGTYGEDGGVQSELARRGLPYTGPGVEASRNAFDKEITKRLALARGIPTAEYRLVQRGDGPPLPLPLVVKAARQGSSIGVHLVKTEAEWAPAVADAFKYDDKVFAEVFIPGREFTVGVLDELVLPVVEVMAPDGWFDYKAKYTGGASRYEVPARLDEAAGKLCQRYAREAFDALGCRGMSRVDFRMTGAGAFNLLEVNTIPGFTDTSLLPKAAAKAGISFVELCDRIMDRACV